MITWFLSKNKKRTTTLEEFVDVIVKNKDLLAHEGMTNIGGIPYYHFINDDDNVQLSYGSYVITCGKKSSSNRAWSVTLDSIGNSGNLLLAHVGTDVVRMYDKNGDSHHIPFTAFQSDTDFFQYSLLNLKYECSDAVLATIINFLMEMNNVKLD